MKNISSVTSRRVGQTVILLDSKDKQRLLDIMREVQRITPGASFYSVESEFARILVGVLLGEG